MQFENINIRKIMQLALTTGGIIVDVRKRDRFAAGHIPMAVNLSLEQIESGNVNLPKAKILILYCDTGGASARAAQILANRGYRVYNCIGGLKNYNGSITK